MVTILCKRVGVLCWSCVLFAMLVTSASAYDYIGDVRLFAGETPPEGWALCNGSTLAIMENTALFSLLGCNFGGDCRTTFNLPDFRGRSAIGTGGDLTGWETGKTGGSETPVRKDRGALLPVAEGAAVDAMPPFTGLNYIIRTQGLYPPRS